MALTKHQQEVLHKGLNILRIGNRLVVKGSAGVGKTYMVNELIKKMIPSNGGRDIYCSAPTNKAVSVLQHKVDKFPGLRFITTHAALKMRRVIDFKTGDVSFQPQFDKKNPPLKGIGIFVIDEASMLNTSLLEYVEDYADRYNVKVIFLGDHKQLNPVGEEESPVFHKGYPEVELTEIVRQGEGNPIIELSRNLNLVKTKENYLIGDVEPELVGYVFSNNKSKVVEELAKVNGTDELKYLAWTNKEVDLMNTLVRNTIYGNPKKIEVGETLVFNSPYDEDNYTNKEIKVESCMVREKEFDVVVNKLGSNEDPILEDYSKSIKLKYYSINYDKRPKDFFNDREIITDNIIVIHEDSEKEYKSVVLQMKQNARNKHIDWRDYYTFVEQFADLKYNHAITVHKSQGSTYKNTIVNVKNLNFNRNEMEKNRLLYTAITRASDLLILYNI